MVSLRLPAGTSFENVYGRSSADLIRYVYVRSSPDIIPLLLISAAAGCSHATNWRARDAGSCAL